MTKTVAVRTGSSPGHLKEDPVATAIHPHISLLSEHSCPAGVHAPRLALWANPTRTTKVEDRPDRTECALLDTQVFADRVGIDKRKVRNLYRTGLIGYHKIGTDIAIPECQIALLLANSWRPPTKSVQATRY